ncbi:hypothetical protein XENTR_v10019522 [Xenopus tropicalis]|nr:hypothetical protein XENTR_v10019522 [Xenopus tropicalis]
MSITCFSLTCIIGTVGNGLVIWITGFKMRKTMTTTWFLNLGIADFSFCLFLPLYITEVAMWGNWPFGQIMCKVRFFIISLNAIASVLFLMAISIDRCVCVLCPIWSRNHRTSSSAAIISVIIWFFSVALSSSYLLMRDINIYYISVCLVTNRAWENITTTDETFNQTFQAIVIFDCVFTLLIPFSIILVCYGLIVFRVKKSRRIHGSAQTLKIIVTTVICFFFCWVLYSVLPVIDVVGHYVPLHHRFLIYTLADCLAFFNSCLNPIIYVFMGRKFKQVLRKSIPFLLESTFRESLDPPEMLEHNNSL